MAEVWVDGWDRDGAALNITFEKNRHGTTDGLSAWLVQGPEGGLVWETDKVAIQDRSEALLIALVGAVRSGKYGTQKELGDAIGVSQSKVSGLLKEAESKGMLEKGEWERAKRKRPEEGSLSEDF